MHCRTGQARQRRGGDFSVGRRLRGGDLCGGQDAGIRDLVDFADPDDGGFRVVPERRIDRSGGIGALAFNQ